MNTSYQGDWEGQLQEEQTYTRPVQTAESGLPAGGIQPSVLVLDDDPCFQDLMARLLESHGYQVSAARSAHEASALISAHAYSLLIVDYRLPMVDGITWITKLREAGNQTPVIFVSGTWCDAKTFNRLRNILHVSLVFQKPIDPGLFIKAVQDVLPVDENAMMEAQSQNRPQIKIDFNHFLEGNEFDQSLAEIDQLIASAADDPQLLDHLNQVKRTVRTQKVVYAARVEYLRLLPGIWQEMLAALADARSQASPANHNLALEFAHKLKGSSGSYGLTHLSQITAQIERFLKCIDTSCTPEELKIFWIEIERLLNEGSAVVEGLTVNADRAEASKDEQPLSLLLVSPDETYQHLVSERPVPNLDFHVVNSAAGALTRAAAVSFDAAIIDLSLGDQSLIRNLTRKLRTTRNARNLPFIFIAAPGQYTSTSELIYSGCTAILEPPVSALALGDAVHYLRRTMTGREKRILCVDDDPMITFFLAKILNQEGFRTMALNEPIHILEALSEFQPDLILLDVIMPGLSGYEICRMLKFNPEWCHVPIIFLTAKVDHDSRSAAFLAGGNDFLAKPIVAPELVARVKSQSIVTEASGRPGTDEMTGLLAAEVFKTTASRKLQQCQRDNTAASLGLIKIEDLAELDLHYGPYSRQHVLAELGYLMSIRFRSEDLRGLVEDGHLAVFFNGESSITTRDAMALLQEEIGRISFTAASGGQFHLKTRVAVADVGKDGLTIDSLFQFAGDNLRFYPDFMTSPDPDNAKRRLPTS